MLGQRAAELDRAMLRRQVLGVGERQIEEIELDDRAVAVVSRLQREFRRRQRPGIGGVGARPVAEDVTRELVEREDQRETCARI